ncbi:MAG TPA: universal stress protein [Dehalococcoidia bacterium]|nr:universal stress protein [Dehalococcoidia bacterium]
MYSTVMVPLDGSELAEAALPHASEIARLTGARMVLVRGFDPIASLAPALGGIGSGGYTAGELIEETARVEHEEAEKYLIARAAELRTQGVEVETRALRGNVIESLTGLARELPSAIVVMTSRGRGGLKRFVLGSVTDALLHRLEIPVVVVPNRPD